MVVLRYFFIYCSPPSCGRWSHHLEECFSILVVVFEPLPRWCLKTEEANVLRKSWPSFRMFDAVAFLIAPYCYCWWFRYPVNSPVEVGSLSHYLQGFYRSQVVQDFFHQQYHPNESRICGSQNCLAVFFQSLNRFCKGLSTIWPGDMVVGVVVEVVFRVHSWTLVTCFWAQDVGTIATVLVFEVPIASMYGMYTYISLQNQPFM